MTHFYHHDSLLLSLVSFYKFHHFVLGCWIGVFLTNLFFLYIFISQSLFTSFVFVSLDLLTSCDPCVCDRHKQPQRHMVYHYRFQVPDSYCYDASSTEFRNEQLENYNWNYLDQYICTRGEADYGLMEVSVFC